MPLEPYTFDAEKSEAYARFCFAHYEGDAGWLPPAKGELLAQFDPRYSFYRRADNRHRSFLLRAGGQVFGHVTAMVNADMLDRSGIAVGTIGFFECINDETAAVDLLSAATEWLRDECGIARIWGPLNFDIWHSYRFMVRGFAERPFYGEPRNKPWYPAFFESFGFCINRRWASLEVTGAARLQAIIARSEHKYRHWLKAGYFFRTINADDSADIARLHTAESSACRDFLGYTPICEADYKELFAVHASRLDTDLVSFAIDPKGQVVGLGAAFSNGLNTADNRGSEPRRRAVFYMIAAGGAETARGHGIGGAIFYHIVRRSIDTGHNAMIFALLAEDSAARYLIGDSMHSAQREYALYELRQ